MGTSIDVDPASAGKKEAAALFASRRRRDVSVLRRMDRAESPTADEESVKNDEPYGVTEYAMRNHRSSIKRERTDSAVSLCTVRQNDESVERDNRQRQARDNKSLTKRSEYDLFFD